MVTSYESPKRIIRWMIQAIDACMEYTHNMNTDDFFADKKTFDACLMQLQHLGESTILLSRHYPKITFPDQKKVMGLRHFISHEYIEIRPSIIRSTITTKLHPLRNNLTTLLDELA